MNKMKIKTNKEIEIRNINHVTHIKCTECFDLGLTISPCSLNFIPCSCFEYNSRVTKENIDKWIEKWTEKLGGYKHAMMYRLERKKWVESYEKKYNVKAGSGVVIKDI